MTRGRVAGEEILADLMRLIDRMPFLAGLKRDVLGLKRTVYDRRAPRIAALGVSGSGRSCLLNGLLGKPAVPFGGETAVGPGRWLRVNAAGARVDWLELGGGRTEETPARGAARLERVLEEMRPDCVLFVARFGAVDETLRASLDEAAHLLSLLTAGEGPRPPVLAVLTGIDAVDGANGADDGASRGITLELERQRFERLLAASPFGTTRVFATAAPPGGPTEGLERLATAIFEQLDERAQLEAARAFCDACGPRREVASRIVRSTSALAATVAVTPVPLSDMFILGPLQVMMVSALAHLSGRTWDRRAARDWLASLGVVGGAGLGFRWGAQQLCKLVPGAGSLVSAGVAGAGTAAIGRSAVAYFLG